MIKISQAATRGFSFLSSLVLILCATLGVMKGGAFAALGISGGLFAALCCSLAVGHWARPSQRSGAVLASFFIFVAALAPLAEHPSATLAEALRVASIFLPLWFWTSPEALDRLAALPLWRAWPWILAGGLLVAAVAMGLTRAKGDIYHLTKYNRGVSYGLLLAWPAICFVSETKGRRWLGLFLLFLVPAFLLTHSRSAQLGMAVGGMVGLGAWLLPVALPRFLAGISVLSAFWPFAAQTLFREKLDWVAKLPDSWRARVEIWDYMSYRIQEKLFWGHGIGASYAQPYAEPNGALYLFTTQPAAHPHNFFVQVWVDFGILGAFCGVGLLLATLREIGRLPETLRTFAYAAWGCAIVLMLSAYDFWTDSFLSALFMTSLLFAVLARRTAAKLSIH